MDSYHRPQYQTQLDYHSVPATEDTGYVPPMPKDAGVPSYVSTPSPMTLGVPPGSPQPAYGYQPAAAWPPPEPLESRWLLRLTRLFFEVCVAVLALLFVVYGFLVYKYDGEVASAPDDAGYKLHAVSQYGPTVFPILFAAIVGSCLKAIATYCLQTSRGATVGHLEQFLGSQTMYRALSTQIQMMAFNPLGIAIVLLWCLSPLGGQASLRVISIVTSHPQSRSSVVAMNTFQAYSYGGASGNGVAKTTIANPVSASIMAASLLSDRNQDLWGNVRVPSLAMLRATGHGPASTGLYTVPTQDTNLTYPSLVGTPVGDLPASGNTSFFLPASYMALSCPVLEATDQTALTNYTNRKAPSPGNHFDCSWAVAVGGSQFQIAVSMPCETNVNSGAAVAASNSTRPVRRLIWESWAQDLNYTHAECELTTVHVEANITCTSSDSGLSGGSTCWVTHVLETANPPADGNWTVLDSGFSGDARSVIGMLSSLYPDAQESGGKQPIVTYLSYPFSAIGSFLGTDADTITADLPSAIFELRLAQLLNSVAVVGLDPPSITGAFNSTAAHIVLARNVSATNMLLVDTAASIVQSDATTVLSNPVVRCSRGWLAVLVIASLIIFVMAVAGAALHAMIIVPDVLESVTLSFLHHRTEAVAGVSVWSAVKWARRNRHVRLFFGDVEPAADAGRIGLARVDDKRSVEPIKVGHMYR